jgi:hypothetical protein
MLAWDRVLFQRNVRNILRRAKKQCLNLSISTVPFPYPSRSSASDITHKPYKMGSQDEINPNVKGRI